MANFTYTGAKEKLAKGTLNLDTVDLRALLVMTNTTADTDQDATSLSGITTLDEYDGTNYARKDLGDPSVTRDDANNRAEVTVSAFTWTALGAGTRNCQAMVLYAYVDGTAANDYPICFVDTGGFPFAGNGGDVTVTPNAEGLIQVG